MVHFEQTTQTKQTHYTETTRAKTPRNSDSARSRAAAQQTRLDPRENIDHKLPRIYCRVAIAKDYRCVAKAQNKNNPKKRYIEFAIGTANAPKPVAIQKSKLPRLSSVNHFSNCRRLRSLIKAVSLISRARPSLVSNRSRSTKIKTNKEVTKAATTPHV